jgi:hypothetical protein
MAMQTETYQPQTNRFAQVVAASKRVHWDIDNDVIRGRAFDARHKYLPDGLSLAHQTSLSADEQRTLSQIQGRTYANVFGLVERFINAKVLELSEEYWLQDQTALQALVGFSAEELKHQELFRRVEAMIADTLPAGYRFVPQPDDVARVVLGKSTWAVLLLTLHIELFTLSHYRESIDPDAALSPLFKDIFLYHWKEESQHAIMDEIELLRQDAAITPEARDAAVNEFIELVGAVDGLLQAQSSEDVRYFAAICGRTIDARERSELNAAMLRAYRWQYILSGAQNPHFLKVLGGLVTGAQGERIAAALQTLQ